MWALEKNTSFYLKSCNVSSLTGYLPLKMSAKRARETERERQRERETETFFFLLFSDRTVQ